MRQSRLGSFSIVVKTWMLALFIAAPVASSLHASEVEGTVSFTQFRHTAWRVAEGTFSSSPTTVTQTSDGYLWFGTESGLIRFDGIKFEPWVDPKTRQGWNDKVISLFPDRTGGLWVASAGNLRHLLHGTIVEAGREARFNQLVMDDEAGLWTVRSRMKGASGALCRVTEGKTNCIARVAKEHCIYGDSLAVGHDHTIWFSGNDGLCSWSPSKQEYFPLSDLKNRYEIGGLTAVAAERDGTIWAGAFVTNGESGLFRLTDGKLVSHAIAGIPAADLDVSKLFVDGEGALWVGTGSHGIFRLQNGDVKHFDASNTLSGDDVNDIYQDREGTVWVATGGGIDRFVRGNVVSVSKVNGLTLDNVSAVSAGASSRVAISNYKEIATLDMNGAGATLRTFSLPGNHVYTSILEDSQGLTWVGVDDQVFIGNHGKFAPIDSPKGPHLGTVGRILQDKTGVVWLWTFGKQPALFWVDVNRFAHPVTISNDENLGPISADPLAGVWTVVNYKRILHFVRGDRVGEILSVQLGKELALAALPSAAGGIWLRMEHRTVLYNKGAYRSITVKNGLPCDAWSSLLVGEQQSLWLSGTCGVVEVSGTEMKAWESDSNHILKFLKFDDSDGLSIGRPSFGPALSQSIDGRVWIANGRTLQMIDLAHLSKNTTPPPIVFKSIVADHRAYEIKDEVKLPPLTRDIQIDYAGLSFASPQRMRFRYILSGVDKDWNEAGEARQANYMNLPPGAYQFTVIGANNDGVWNQQGATMKLIIPPTFTQRASFRVACLVLFILLAICGFMLRLHMISESIKSRLSERIVERERIARELHDTLLQGFQGLVLRFAGATRKLPPDAEVRVVMENALDYADEVLSEGRRRVAEIRSDNPIADGLPAAFRNVANLASSDTGQQFSIEAFGEEKPLDPLAEEEIYWIGREALNNAYSHSGGTAFTVQIVYKPKGVNVTWWDNGNGIDPQIVAAGHRTGHWGFQGMRERAKKIGAVLKIESEKDKGTLICLTVPAKTAYRSTWTQRLLRVLPFEGDG